jgi:hypothetical protein
LAFFFFFFFFFFFSFSSSSPYMLHAAPTSSSVRSSF